MWIWQHWPTSSPILTVSVSCQFHVCGSLFVTGQHVLYLLHTPNSPALHYPGGFSGRHFLTCFHLYTVYSPHKHLPNPHPPFPSAPHPLQNLRNSHINLPTFHLIPPTHYLPETRNNPYTHATNDPHPHAFISLTNSLLTKPLHCNITLGLTILHIFSRYDHLKAEVIYLLYSWGWAYWCPKHVQAIKLHTLSHLFGSLPFTMS
jgi:hypothetical protein